MTTPEHPSPPPPPSVPQTRDRAYRSPAGIAGGVLLLAIAGWLGIDAVVAGEGRTPWLALATLLLVVPVVVAYTVRPAVFAGEDRLRVRNPLRVVVLPWGRVASLRSGYSNEVVADSGAKYQLWAVPVSLRARKKAARQETRRAAGEAPRGGLFGGRGGGGPLGAAGADRAAALAADDGPVRAETDRIMDELRALREARESEPTAQGEVTVRWAYEVIAPAVTGAVLLAVLLALG
ncbi:PH domain-containing protein [Streptomyces fumanus]|uniref:Membrane protein n=1 Tax=Streptomyces fumanus TaxID=67302 RepID=A0A919AJQ2_9ACTN|nr:PH domain-containing protein [Streptomyces fumanus]GHF12668.1 membrane protein [Streptomyces fumanus]